MESAPQTNSSPSVINQREVRLDKFPTMGIGSSVVASVKSVIDSGRKLSSATSFITLTAKNTLLRCLQEESGCIVKITPHRKSDNILRLVKFAIHSKLYSSSDDEITSVWRLVQLLVNMALFLIHYPTYSLELCLVAANIQIPFIFFKDYMP